MNSTKSTDGGGLTNAFSDRLSSLLTAMHAAPYVWSIGISAQNLGQSLTPPPPTESSVQMPVIIIDRVCCVHKTLCNPHPMSAMKTHHIVSPYRPWTLSRASPHKEMRVPLR